MKQYIKLKLKRRRGFSMRIFIGQNTRGYTVESFDGNNLKMLDQGVPNKKKARDIAESWKAYYEHLGRGVRISDLTNR